MDRLSGKDLAEASDPANIHIPTNKDLFEALENILWFWPGIFVQWVKEGQAIPEFDLLRTVRLTGQYEGLVILRTSEELGASLASTLLEDRPSTGADAFSEFANMFCGHIMNKIRGSEEVAFRHFLPQPAPDSGWPARPPEARMTVAVAKIPLEVQLWIDQVPVTLERA